MKIKFITSNPSSSAATSSPINRQDQIVNNENPNWKIAVPEPITAPIQIPSPTDDSPSAMVLSNHASKSARSKRVNNKSKTCAMARAEEVLSSLDPNFPTCLKTMMRSHVSSSFWMGLSNQFCKIHLPKKDLLLTVEDESGKEYEMKYIFQRTALSGGWRSFAIVQKLREDDVVIFQFVKPLEPIKLKVYIIRANDAADEVTDIGHENLDAHTKQNDAEKGSSKISEKSLGICTTERKLSKSHEHDFPQKKKRTGLGKLRIPCSPPGFEA